MFSIIEEEAKRLAVDKSAYNQVGFSYQDDNKTKDSTNTSSEGKCIMMKIIHEFSP